MAILTLLTDFGRDDYYVAAVKGVVLAAAPETTLVDIGHDVAAGDVEGAAFLLAAAAPVFPAGTVHLAVVDPGVGSERRILAVDDGRHRLLAPDNGLLTPWLAAPGAEVFAVDRPDLYRPSPGATFHGRDRFAPLAAALLGGTACAELGPRLDAAAGRPEAVRLALPPPRRAADALDGRVAHVDRFGNAVTDLPASWLERAAGHELEVELGRQRRRALSVRCYADLEPGRAGILTGSLGTLEISLRDASLADAWGLRRGDPVRVVPPRGVSLRPKE